MGHSVVRDHVSSAVKRTGFLFPDKEVKQTLAHIQSSAQKFDMTMGDIAAMVQVITLIAQNVLVITQIIRQLLEQKK